jgi:hypothetical protein
MLSQVSVTVLPTGEMIPRPVTTTLRRDKMDSWTGGESEAAYFLRLLLM